MRSIKTLFRRALDAQAKRRTRAALGSKRNSLWQLQPVSRVFALDRGQPIDRFYIERFLRDNANYIHGQVLEIEDNKYTKEFGGQRVAQSHVLHAVEGNPAATIVGDLTNAPHIPSDSFDCIICTQTLQFIYDIDAAVTTLHRILKPGGTLLVTLSGIS